jgi:hypothetical protein
MVTVGVAAGAVIIVLGGTAGARVVRAVDFDSLVILMKIKKKAKQMHITARPIKGDADISKEAHRVFPKIPVPG